MTKNVDDYITEGLYGVRLPKEEERIRFLGTLRERIVLALTIGQVMTDSGLKHLENAMREHPNARLIMNGHVSYRFLSEEKALANRYNIPYTTITTDKNKTDIGAVLTYDYAIEKENIYINEDETVPNKKEKKEKETFFSKILERFR